MTKGRTIVFEEWRIDNIPISLNKKLNINNALKDIRKFSDFEQEIIYCLLIGYRIDKEIEQFLTQLTLQKIKGNVKYTISTLYEKFHCDCRSDLINLLKAHGLNVKLPKSIFPSGEYLI